MEARKWNNKSRPEIHQHAVVFCGQPSPSVSLVWLCSHNQAPSKSQSLTDYASSETNHWTESLGDLQHLQFCLSPFHAFGSNILPANDPLLFLTGHIELQLKKTNACIIAKEEFPFPDKIKHKWNILIFVQMSYNPVAKHVCYSISYSVQSNYYL